MITGTNRGSCVPITCQDIGKTRFFRYTDLRHGITGWTSQASTAWHAVECKLCQVQHVNKGMDPVQEALCIVRHCTALLLGDNSKSRCRK